MYPVFRLDLNLNKPKDLELYHELQTIVNAGPSLNENNSIVHLICSQPNYKEDQNILSIPNEHYCLISGEFLYKEGSIFIYFRKISKKEIKDYLELYKLFGTSIGDFLSK